MDVLSSLMSVLEVVDQGIHVVDRDGVTVVYNRAASEIDGLSESEVIGRSLLQVFPSLDQDSSTLLRVLRTGKHESAKQQTFTNYKGKKITTVNFTTPIFDDGKVVGACEISTDVTRMKEMAEKIVDLQRELKDKGDTAKGSSKERAAAPFERRLYTMDDIVGESPAIKEVKSRALSVAGSDASVLVWGETGTGKELLVQAIHSASSRRRGPFVPQNSAALPESLLEGLVFGTVRGGFTGSMDRPGLLELASGGTLYLDEIDSMPPGLQAKLLRVIQDKRVRRLGDTRERPVDVRIIASTGSNPAYAVQSGLLRPDLYYRLSVVEIGMPPLRERRADIPLLCERFFTKYAAGARPRSLSPQVMAAFLAYDWPGNVREIEHAIQGSLAVAKGAMIVVEDLPAAVRGILATASLYRQDKGQPQDKSQSTAFGIDERLVPDIPATASNANRFSLPATPLDFAADTPTGSLSGSLSSTGQTLKDAMRSREKETIKRALSESGSVAGAARLLGVPRQTLQYRMKVLEISGTTLA